MRNKSLLFVLLSFLSISSCKKDDTNPTGTGDVRDTYVGIWTCQETSSSGTITYEISIYKSQTSATQVFLENLYNYGISFIPIADINAAGDIITIANQVIQGNVIEGSGTLLSPTAITLNYTVDDGSIIDHVNASLTKK